MDDFRHAFLRGRVPIGSAANEQTMPSHRGAKVPVSARRPRCSRRFRNYEHASAYSYSTNGVISAMRCTDAAAPRSQRRPVSVPGPGRVSHAAANTGHSAQVREYSSVAVMTVTLFRRRASLGKAFACSALRPADYESRRRSSPVTPRTSSNGVLRASAGITWPRIRRSGSLGWHLSAVPAGTARRPGAAPGRRPAFPPAPRSR